MVFFCGLLGTAWCSHLPPFRSTAASFVKQCGEDCYHSHILWVTPMWVNVTPLKMCHSNRKQKRCWGSDYSGLRSSGWARKWIAATLLFEAALGHKTGFLPPSVLTTPDLIIYLSESAERCMEKLISSSVCLSLTYFHSLFPSLCLKLKDALPACGGTFWSDDSTAGFLPTRYEICSFKATGIRRELSPSLTVLNLIPTWKGPANCHHLIRSGGGEIMFRWIFKYLNQPCSIWGKKERKKHHLVWGIY